MKFIALCVIIVAICGQTSIREEQSVLEMFPAYKDYKVKLDNRIRVIEAQMQQMKIKLEEIGQSLRSFLRKHTILIIYVFILLKLCCY